MAREWRRGAHAPRALRGRGGINDMAVGWGGGGGDAGYQPGSQEGVEISRNLSPSFFLPLVVGGFLSWCLLGKNVQFVTVVQ